MATPYRGKQSVPTRTGRDWPARTMTPRMLRVAVGPLPALENVTLCFLAVPAPPAPWVLLLRCDSGVQLCVFLVLE